MVKRPTTDYADRKKTFTHTTGPLAGVKFDAKLLKELTGVNSAKAIELREQFYNYNENLKKKKNIKGSDLPIILIPRHDLKIYRHVKYYDPQTGYLQRPKAIDEEATIVEGDKKKGTSKKVTDREAKIKYFEVQAKDGMSDFLGIKFEYTYDKEITLFTLSFNNERGKNRNRFMSGDVIEFYFDLVDEKTIIDLERENFHIRKEDIKMELPLVFTGTLEKMSINNSTDSLTIDWHGRNAAYILTERNINFNYPLATETFVTSVGEMSYEEIIWNMITFGTGMVVGEVDLGNKKTFYYLGTEAIDLEAEEKKASAKKATGDTNTNASDVASDSMDLMSQRGLRGAEDRSGGRSNNTLFRIGLAEVMKKHAFCRVGGGSDEKDDKSAKPRWSSLLEFDLMRPKVFSMIEIEDQGASGGSTDQLSKMQGLVGSYIYGSSSEDNQDIPASIRFKTKWGQAVFNYCYKIMKQNYNDVLEFAPIKAEVSSDTGEHVKAFLITQELLLKAGPGFSERKTSGSNMDKLLKRLYHELNNVIAAKGKVSPLTDNSKFKIWKDRAIAVYNANKDKANTSDFFASSDGKWNNEKAKQAANFNLKGQTSYNRDASKIALGLQDPRLPPDNGTLLLLPVPLSKKFSHHVGTFHTLKGSFASISTINSKQIEDVTKAPILSVKSIAKLRETDKIEITLIGRDAVAVGGGAGGAGTSSPDARFNLFVEITIRKTTTGGGWQTVVASRVISNNLTLITSVIDNSGILTASLMNDSIKSPSQPVGCITTPSDFGTNLSVGKRVGTRLTLVPATEGSAAAIAGATKVSNPFQAKGRVLECVKRVMDKFFACILYVDEFNIAHIRPRYKMLQFETDLDTPPIWGLYSGSAVYPRLFKGTWKDKLKITPNSVVVIGSTSSKNNPYIIAKANHGMLQGRFGEYQVLDDKANESFSNKFEAYNCAKNRLLSYVRKGYQANVECDIIPALRPGHRIDIADTVTGMIGGFLIENIQWHYAKNEGMKMTMNLSSQMLLTQDSYTTTALESNKGLDAGTVARNFNGGYQDGGSSEKKSSFESVIKQSNIDLLKAENSSALTTENKTLEAEMETYRNRDALVFELDDDGKIKPMKRAGFEKPINPESIPK